MNAVRFYTAVMICGLSVLLSGCHRSRYHRLDQLPGGTLQVEFDWNGYTEIPPGMNLVFYPLTDDATEEEAEGDAQPIVHQLQYDGGKVSVPYGRYNVAVYNDYTYNILYRGMGDFHTAEAYVDDNIRQPLATRLPDLRHVAEPDLFYVTQYNGLTVSPSDGDRVITLRPELVTLMLHVHVRGTGLENVKMADGALSGIAGSVMLSTGYSSDEAASDILFPFEVHPESCMPLSVCSSYATGWSLLTP